MNGLTDVILVMGLSALEVGVVLFSLQYQVIERLKCVNSVASNAKSWNSGEQIC